MPPKRLFFALAVFVVVVLIVMNDASEKHEAGGNRGVSRSSADGGVVVEAQVEEDSEQRELEQFELRFIGRNEDDAPVEFELTLWWSEGAEHGTHGHGLEILSTDAEAWITSPETKHGQFLARSNTGQYAKGEIGDKEWSKGTIALQFHQQVNTISGQLTSDPSLLGSRGYEGIEVFAWPVDSGHTPHQLTSLEQTPHLTRSLAAPDGKFSLSVPGSGGYVLFAFGQGFASNWDRQQISISEDDQTGITMPVVRIYAASMSVMRSDGSLLGTDPGLVAGGFLVSRPSGLSSCPSSQIPWAFLATPRNEIGSLYGNYLSLLSSDQPVATLPIMTLGVRVPGFASREVELELHSVEGRAPCEVIHHTIEVDPITDFGSLEVHFAGLPVDGDGLLEFYGRPGPFLMLMTPEHGGRQLSWEPLGEAARSGHQIDGIPVGAYQVRLESLEAVPNGIPIDPERVVIEAGETAKIDLEFSDVRVVRAMPSDGDTRLSRSLFVSMRSTESSWRSSWVFDRLPLVVILPRDEVVEMRVSEMTGGKSFEAVVVEPGMSFVEFDH